MRHSKRSREERRRDAMDRDAARAKRSDKAQLLLLDQRPGESAREREKLLFVSKHQATKAAKVARKAKAKKN